MTPRQWDALTDAERVARWDEWPGCHPDDVRLAALTQRQWDALSGPEAYLAARAGADVRTAARCQAERRRWARVSRARGVSAYQPPVR
jgi:hypothetical protein